MEGDNGENQGQSSILKRGINWFSSYFWGEAQNQENDDDDDHHDLVKEASDDNKERQQDEEEQPEEELAAVCMYFLEGRCRFGDDCHFRHPEELAPVAAAKEGKTTRRGRKVPGEEKQQQRGKKSSMKTAMDVIQRIQWDADMPPEYFYVGYLDRFKGVQEEPFSRYTYVTRLYRRRLQLKMIPIFN